MRFGIFTTLNGPGSRAMVTAVLDACRRGRIPNGEVAFVLVNRAAGEAPVTDQAVLELAAEHEVPFIRSSAFRFNRAERQAARIAEEAGDPAPMAAWRDAWYSSFRDGLPSTELDLALGDLWIWGPLACSERRGLNLHPALPWGPLGMVWHQVLWRLVAEHATESGIMLHRVIPAVDEGPVVSYCRYNLLTPTTLPLWSALPSDPDALAAMIAAESALGKASQHPLLLALRELGLKREVPLVLATLRAFAAGQVAFAGEHVVDAAGQPIDHGLELTGWVDAAVDRSDAGLKEGEG